MTEIIWAHHFPRLRCSHTLDRIPEDHNPMHTHAELEIYYFISGNCTYVIEGTSYALKPHDIVFKRPMEAHMLVKNSRDVPYERMAFTVPIDLFQSLDPENTLFSDMMARPLGTRNRFTDNDFGHTLCTELMEHMVNNGAAMEQNEFLGSLLFVASEAARVLRNKTDIRRSSNIGTRIIDYVNERLLTDISLESISAAFFLSKSQINRIFKAHTGSTVVRYLTTKRLLTARDYIRSGMSASEACFACGYNDYSVFYRAYIQQFGTSPQADKQTAAKPT